MRLTAKAFYPKDNELNLYGDYHWLVAELETGKRHRYYLRAQNTGAGVKVFDKKLSRSQFLRACANLFWLTSDRE